MACPCKNKNGGSAAKATYKVTEPDGTTKTFTNEPDARLHAAKTRGKFKRVAA